jgi:hypothetical protein
VSSTGTGPDAATTSDAGFESSFDSGRQLQDAPAFDARDAGGSSEGGACDGGSCLLALASGQHSPGSIVVDRANVYWIDSASQGLTDGAIMKVSRAGGTPIAMASGYRPVDIAVDASGVYFTDDWFGAIFKVPLAGGAPTMLAAGQSGPTGIALDATNVYWTDQVKGTVSCVPVGGGSTRILATGQPGAYGVAVDATSVYFTAMNLSAVAGGMVMSVPVVGGSPKTLATGQDTPAGIAVDATRVYWVDLALSGSYGGLRSVALGGGTATILNYGGPQSWHIALDAAYVYYASASQVFRLPLAGGANTALTSNLNDPEGMVVDGSNLFFATIDGFVMTKALP